VFKEMIPALSQIDTRLLLILAGLAAVLVVISLVKKAIKVGIFLLIVAVIFASGVPAINKLKESYNVSYSKLTETLTLRVAGKDFSVSIKEIKEAKNYSIKLERGGTNTKISLFYQRKDGTAVSERGVEIPNFMMDVVTKYFDGSGLQYTTDASVIAP